MPRIPPSSLLRRLALPLGCVVGWAALASSPSPLQGRWEVVQVAVDHRDQPHWLYFPDDPRLLGRQLDIGSDGIRLDDGSRPCLKPAMTALRGGTLQHFIGARYPRPAAFATPARPTLADFGLKLADVPVAPLQVACTPGDSPWNGAWFVALSADRLLTNYDNNGYVLILRRRGKHDPVRASFACAKSRGATEQAICSSATLAGYDRSVAAAYRFALRRAGDEARTIRQAQRDWIVARNACGADADCLGRSMRERLEQLMQP
ncbi:lysozyme inhibitor LprI family protein [Rhodanobacter aciditrophus]|uniref:lysozyme inhibitor LprI family protein n=1 Tax=Rhodanobacter aciditrophus TaxID=1623218 RepID=UPI003CF6A0AC